MARKPSTASELFSTRVDKSGICWILTGTLHKNGYGTVTVNRKKNLAHRLSFELHKGPISAGMHIMHSCDNRICVNPEHLSEGTHNDNMRDMAIKGRSYNKRKTHCKSGHEFTAENTYSTPGKPGYRCCRMCQRIVGRALLAKSQAERTARGVKPRPGKKLPANAPILETYKPRRSRTNV